MGGENAGAGPPSYLVLCEAAVHRVPASSQYSNRSQAYDNVPIGFPLRHSPSLSQGQLPD